MIILAIEFFAINGLSIIIPTNVRIEASKDSIEKNCSLNCSSSISNQDKPGPGPGMALNIKIIIAVPTIVNLNFSGNSLISLFIRNKMINIEPTKTISCANGKPKEPTLNVKITKTKLKQIIKEELESVLSESAHDAGQSLS